MHGLSDSVVVITVQVMHDKIEGYLALVLWVHVGLNNGDILRLSANAPTYSTLELKLILIAELLIPLELFEQTCLLGDRARKASKI